MRSAAPRPPAASPVLSALVLCAALLGAAAAARAQAPPPVVGTVQVDATRLADEDAPAPDDPAGATVLDLSRPGARGAARSVSVAEVLREEISVRVRSAGALGQYSAALLRGAASTQVSVLIDGVPLSRGGQAAIDLSQLPVDGLQRIEIYRGLPPLSFGPDAIGGAINLVSRRGGQPQSGVVLGAGWFGLRKLSATTSGRSGGVDYAATLGYHGANGDFPYFYTQGLRYSAPPREAVRQNDGFDQVAADLRTSARHGPIALRATAHGFLKRQGLAGIGQPGAEPGAPSLDTGRARLSLGMTARARSSEILLDLHGLLERSLYRDLATARLSEQLGLQGGALLQVKWLASADQLLHAALDARLERFRSEDLCPVGRNDCQRVRATTSGRARLTVALGADLRFAEDKVVLQPGVQVLYARSQLQPLSGDPAAQRSASELASGTFFVAPRVGARALLLSRARGELALRATLGRSLRLPTFQELFGDPRLFSSSIGLQPESAWAGELGLRGALTLLAGRLRLSLDLAGFARHIQNLIDQRQNGPFLQAYNVGAAQMLGGEVEVRASLGQRLALRLGYAGLDARDRGDNPDRYGRVLPSRPPHAFALRADGDLFIMRLYYELDLTAALYLDPANLNPRPARALHHLGARLAPHPRLPLTLEIEVQNLLDTRLLAAPRLADSRGEAGLIPLVDFFDYPLPGRALYATLSWRR